MSGLFCFPQQNLKLMIYEIPKGTERCDIISQLYTPFDVTGDTCQF